MVNGTTACAPARSLSQHELFKLLLLEVLTGARVDAKQAESGLLYAQGTIAGALANQTASSQLDRNRIAMLSDAGFLTFFKQHSGSGKQPQEKP